MFSEQQNVEFIEPIARYKRNQFFNNRKTCIPTRWSIVSGAASDELTMLLRSRVPRLEAATFVVVCSTSTWPDTCRERDANCLTDGHYWYAVLPATRQKYDYLVRGSPNFHRMAVHAQEMQVNKNNFSWPKATLTLLWDSPPYNVG